MRPPPRAVCPPPRAVPLSLGHTPTASGPQVLLAAVSCPCGGSCGKHEAPCVPQVGERLGRYEVEKRCAVEKEDYDLAKEKKQQMEQYRAEVYQQLQLHSLLDAELVGTGLRAGPGHSEPGQDRCPWAPSAAQRLVTHGRQSQRATVLEPVLSGCTAERGSGEVRVTEQGDSSPFAGVPPHPATLPTLVRVVPPARDRPDPDRFCVLSFHVRGLAPHLGNSCRQVALTYSTELGGEACATRW